MTHSSSGVEDQLTVWRCSLLAHDEILGEDIDELEAHVREAVAERVADGATESHAVADAIAEVGAPRVIAAEYAKADPTRVWRRRAQRMLAGQLVVSAMAAAVGLPAIAVGSVLMVVGTSDRRAALAAVVTGGVGLLAAVVLVGAVSRGRPRRLVAALYPFAARWRAALLVSTRARRTLLGLAAVVSLAGWIPVPFKLEPLFGDGDVVVFRDFFAVLAGSIVAVAPAIIAFIHWAHRGRGALARTPLVYREAATAVGRWVRWMLVGRLLVILTEIVAGLLGAFAVGGAWRTFATYDQVLAAFIGAHVIVVGGAVAMAIAVSQGRPGRLTRKVDRAVNSWREASWLGSAGRAVGASFSIVILLGALDALAFAACLDNQYVGLGPAAFNCQVAGTVVLPPLSAALLLLTLRPARAKGRGDAREATA